MKILMLTWEYPPRIVGGIARVVHDLSKRLIKDGHEVTVVTYRDNADVPEYENDKGVNVYRVDNYMIHPNNFIDWILQLNFNLVSKATEIINKEGGFDVIHAHDWLVANAAKALKNAYGIPVVATIHATEAGRNSGIHDTQRYINDTEWMLTYEASEVIVNSNYMKNELQRLFGLPYEKINVIPNGINLSNFIGIERDYDFRRQYAMDNEKIILYVGRLVYEKGIQHLIAAMPKVLSNYHDAKLIIAGRGGMMDELRQEASNLGLNDKIYFTGYLDSKQVQKMYKCADVAVFPSTYEPFGIVALEAMLAGVPTVVSDVGGLDEIVTHGVDGMKAYAGNANSIADSITALLYDHQLATNVSKKAKQKVKEQFNWEKIAQDTHFTYEKAVCQTMAERQAKQILQERAKKAKKAKGTENEITNLLSFKQRQAFA